MKNAKAVTLSECQKFLKDNYQHTWLHPGFRKELKLDYKCTFKIKYIDFQFDTRDWRVWKITGRGLSNEFEVSTHDKFDGTILDLLTKKLKLKEKENELCKDKQRPISTRTACTKSK